MPSRAPRAAWWIAGLALLAVAVMSSSAERAAADELPAAVERALHPRDGWPVHWPRAPLLDRARAATGAEIAWARHGTLGEGATVCVIDTGIDLRHRDFLDQDGHTRVRWLVDLEGAPRGEEPDLEERAGGAIWSAASIDRALALGAPIPGDPHGHGTAIASVAAGDDATSSDAPGPFAGIAPRASLIVVRALRAGSLGFEDRDVAIGAELCFALAGRGELPTRAAHTVALLALGGHDGAHDGSERLERALDAIAREGHALIVAAGNDGDRSIHASGRALRSRPARVTVHVPSPLGASTDQLVALTVRTAGAVALIAPDGARVDRRPGALTTVEHAGGYLAIDARAAITRAVIGGGGDDRPELRGGDYTLLVEGDGVELDAWIALVRLGDSLGAPRLTGPHVSLDEAVAIPATATGVIAVGASVTRALWDEGLALRAREDGSATFSARGPTASARPRPDLIAPGGFVVAALSGDLVPGAAHDLIGGSRVTLDRRSLGADRIAVEGSSIAAAIVAGAHALAYSVSPADRRRDVALLRATARGDAPWSASAGAGELAIDAWLDARAGRDAGGGIDRTRSGLALTRSLAVPGAELVAIARILDVGGRPLHGGELVLRRDGAIVARAVITHGIAELELDADGAAGDTLRFDAEVDGEPIASASVAIRIDEGELGEVRAGGGGCAISPRQSDGAIAALLLFAIGLPLAPRRSRAGRSGATAPARPHGVTRG
jgi:subtilisin family serine protease